MESPSRFFTIGYLGLGIRRFLAILKENRVRTLVDVRYNNFSYNPDFSGKLPTHIQENGMVYVHLREYGIPSKIRKSGDAMTWYRHNVVPAINRSIVDSFEHPVCFMCKEADINDCHRKAILEKLLHEGLVGKDLYPAGFVPPADSKRSSPWDEQSFFRQVEENLSAGKLSQKDKNMIRALHKGCKDISVAKKGVISWGRGKGASFIFSIPPLTRTKMLFKMDSEGMLQISVANLPEEKRELFVKRLKDIPPITGKFAEPQGNYYIKKEFLSSAVIPFLDCVNAL